MSKFLDYPGLEYYNDKVQGQISQLGLKVNDPDNEWARIVTDSDGKIVEGIRRDGTKVHFGPVEIDRAAKAEWQRSPEWVKVVTDKNGLVVAGIKTDGSVYFNNVDGLDTKITRAVKSFYDEQPVSVWSGKEIAWYGTSIPYGVELALPITGHAIKAFLRFGLTRNYSDIDQLPASYPIIASSLAGAKAIYNMSQGGSRLVRNYQTASLLLRCLALENTAAENASYIFGSYNIDVTNKTFSRNTSNTIGITEFLPNYEANWTTFVNEALLLISQSYEVRLMANFLIDEESLPTYQQTIFGEYYDQINTMLSDVGMTMNDLAGHRGDVDLFVLEHSVNDTVDTSVALDSSDDMTFAGAMNKIIDIIRFYKPSARIAIVANYIDLASKPGVTDYLGRIAERQALPFADMSKVSGVSYVPQLTCGYWDANGYWHDTGFQWSENAGSDTFTTNCTFPSEIYSSSLAQMKQNVNPHQVDGVWCWESAILYQWCADGLHPHSDRTGRLTILLARMLAKFLDTIGYSR